VSRDAGAGAGARDGTGSSSMESIVANSVSEFSARLEAAKEAVHTSTVIDAKAFLESFIETHLSGALPKLCALHPCHPRVTALAVWLIRKQAREQQGALMAFLSSYALRKLGEVSSASGKQFKKAIDGGIGIKSEIALYPASPVLLRSTRSSPRSHRADRKAKVSACIVEIRKYFTLRVDCADGTTCGSKVTADAKEINVECFVLKPLHIHCSGVATKGLSGTGTETGKGTGTGTETETETGTSGLLDNRFQNGMACICEAIHDLVEVMAAAAGDVIPFEPTARSSLDAPGSSATCANSFDTEFPPRLRGNPDRGSARDTVSLPLPLPVPQGPSWASMLSRRGPDGPTPLKQDQLTRSVEISRAELTRAETVTAVENTRRVIVAMMTWAAVQMQQGVGDLAGGAEAAGKLSIQIVKLMTSCMPSLLYFDIFLGQCMSASSGLSYLCCPFSPYKSQSPCNPGRKWDVFIAADGCPSPSCAGLSDREVEGEGHHPYPSDVLSAAASLNLLTAESLSFVLTASSRQTTLNYFSACKDLPFLKEKLASAMRAFIGRYYLVLYRSGQVRRAASEGEIVSERSTARDTVSEGDPQVVFNGLCFADTDSTWFREQSALSMMTREINIDIMNIFVKLCK
jgi:hypothetical protein